MTESSVQREFEQAPERDCVRLTGGFSNSRGIYFSGSADGEERAAYARRMAPGGEITCLAGEAKQVLSVFKEDMDQAKMRPDSEDMKDVFLPGLVGLVLVILMALFGGQLSYTLGMLVFVVAAYFPVETFIVALRDRSIQTPQFQQYRRNHGAEHTLVGYCRKNEKKELLVIRMEDLSGYSYLDPECGTVWWGTLFIFALVLGVAVAFGPAWGLGKALLVIAAAAVVLFANVALNPANPLKLIQKAEVAEPTALELETAIAAYEALMGAGESKLS